jgi:hypothetical protein
VRIERGETKPFWAFANLEIGGLDGGCDTKHGEDTAAGNFHESGEKIRGS